MPGVSRWRLVPRPRVASLSHQSFARDYSPVCASTTTTTNSRSALCGCSRSQPGSELGIGVLNGDDLYKMPPQSCLLFHNLYSVTLKNREMWAFDTRTSLSVEGLRATPVKQNQPRMPVWLHPSPNLSIHMELLTYSHYTTSSSAQGASTVTTAGASRIRVIREGATVAPGRSLQHLDIYIMSALAEPFAQRQSQFIHSIILFTGTLPLRHMVAQEIEKQSRVWR